MPGDAIENLVPLRTNWLYILGALAGGEKAGYAIMQEVLQRTGGSVRLWPATLYNTLKQLMDAGVIEESGSRPRANEDQRRRYYRLTRTGRRVLDAELGRLEALIQDVRANMNAGRAP